MSDCEHLSLSLYQGVPHACSYLADRISTVHIVDPEFPLEPVHYGCLMMKGFRRSGDVVYRPACGTCNACKPARIPVALFRPNRSQKRCRTLNKDIELYFVPASFKHDHFELYKRYLDSRHQSGEMVADSIDDMQRFLLSSWSKIEMIEGWLDGKLVMAAIADVTPAGLSAIYTFFDPSLAKRSLGTFGILCQIDRSRELGLSFLYLGYWIAECRKMAYKENFHPLEILDPPNNWAQLETL